MRYEPAQAPASRDPQALAEFLMRELRRISASIASLAQDGFDDLRFPAQGINPSGSPAPPAVDNSTSASAVTGALLFSGSLENVIAGVAQTPHAAKLGTPLWPHIHWSKPLAAGDARDVTWVFYYRHLGNPSKTAEPWIGPWTGSFVVGNATAAECHLITEFSFIDMTARRESTCINWRLHRLGNSDTLNDVVRLYELDFHHRIDRLGSPGIYGGPA